MTAPVSNSVPVSARAADAPLSVQSADYHATVVAGATPIDIRSARKREIDGALLGAVALDAAEALELLTPGSPIALRGATHDSRWVIVSDDGHEAEWLTWHLQARGVAGAVFVVGGFQRLRRDRVNGRISAGELAVFSAH